MFGTIRNTRIIIAHVLGNFGFSGCCRRRARAGRICSLMRMPSTAAANAMEKKIRTLVVFCNISGAYLLNKSQYSLGRKVAAKMVNVTIAGE